MIARLIDNIWAVRKAEVLNGRRLVSAQMTRGARAGEQLVVIDTISTGIGNRVIVTTGPSVCRMLKDDEIPVDAVVAGIIDEDYTLDIEHV